MLLAKDLWVVVAVRWCMWLSLGQLFCRLVLKCYFVARCARTGIDLFCRWKRRWLLELTAIDHAARLVRCQLLSKVKVVLDLPDDCLIISYTSAFSDKFHDIFFPDIEAWHTFSFLSECFADLFVKRFDTLLTHELWRTLLHRCLFCIIIYVYRERLDFPRAWAQQNTVFSLWDSLLGRFGPWEIV